MYEEYNGTLVFENTFDIGTFINSHRSIIYITILGNYKYELLSVKIFMELLFFFFFL